jgi:hypothetical protein
MRGTFAARSRHTPGTTVPYCELKMDERTPMNEPDAYQTYVVRLWRAQCHGVWQWRASLESPGTGERLAFATLGQLLAFLGERCDSQVPGVTKTPG